nr:hypothetical protein [Tanacetum cinerariifolium]
FELTALCTSLQRQYFELQAKFQAQEEEIVKLKNRVKVLEDIEGVATTQSGDDAPIKGRSINEREAAAERITNNSEEIARVLTSMDAATVLAGGIDVPTGSGFIPTAGPPATVISTGKEIARVLTSMDAATVLAGEANVPTGSGFIPTAGLPATIVSTGSEVGPTASPIVRRRKGKEVMVESDTPKKKLQEQIDAQVARELEEQQEREDMRMNEQIARDAEVARIHAEEEIQKESDTPKKKKLQEQIDAQVARELEKQQEKERI